MAQENLDQAPRNWRLEYDQDNIAWLFLDHASDKVNTLGSEVLAELEGIIKRLKSDRPTGLALMSGKSGSFIVGADVREFDQTDDVDELRANVKKVHRLFQQIEDLEFPTVVAFEGFCLGGGLELALCFDWRIALNAEHTRIGFPEVKLGIYPGFGGSGRSIRAIGAPKAMELMLTGRMLRAGQARGLGLVDQLTSPHGSLRWAARQAVLKGKSSSRPGIVARAANTGPARKLLAGMMRKKTAAKARPEHYPAPFSLIDAFEECGNDCLAMIAEESRRVPELLAGETSRNLRRVFRLMEGLKAEGKRSDFKARRVHVIGAGVMGGDIAAWCALRGLEVTLQDREQKFIKPAIKRAEKLFARRLKKPDLIAAARSRLLADLEGRGVERADVIIEAIYEDRDAKREVFSRLNGRVKNHAILATNTSAIPLSELADVLDEPQRLIGLHFFNPVAQMPLVEVVQDKKSDPGVVDDGCSFATQIGKYALPVTSTPGFLVNRVLAPYMRNAMAMHRDGVPKEALDEAAEQFGMPMGPVELADTVGLDVGLSVIDTLMGDEAGEEKKILEDMVSSGHKGKKTGEGFYAWRKGKPVKDRKAIEGQDLDLLAEKLMKPYLDECRASLDDKVVRSADLLDAGMIFGTGFAPFRGGPMHYLEALKAGKEKPTATTPDPADHPADESNTDEDSKNG